MSLVNIKYILHVTFPTEFTRGRLGIVSLPATQRQRFIVKKKVKSASKIIVAFVVGKNAFQLLFTIILRINTGWLRTLNYLTRKFLKYYQTGARLLFPCDSNLMGIIEKSLT